MMAVGLVVAPLLLIAFPEPFPPARVVWLSAGIGVIGTASVALLYTGLAMGRMSVVAPISAVGGSVIPVFWGIARGERPSAIAIVGVVAAICAIGLVAQGPGAEPIGGGSRTRELAVAIGAGIGFGVVFILFAETGDSAGFWPVLLSRCFSVPIVLGLALVTGRSLRLPPAALKPAVAAGIFDVSAERAATPRAAAWSRHPRRSRCRALSGDYGAPGAHGAEGAHAAHADRGPHRGAHGTGAHRHRLMLTRGPRTTAVSRCGFRRSRELRGARRRCVPRHRERVSVPDARRRRA